MPDSDRSATTVADERDLPEIDEALKAKEAQILLELEGDENPLHWSRRKKVRRSPQPRPVNMEPDRLRS